MQGFYRKNQSGFTLLEMIIVVAIIAVLSTFFVATLDPFGQLEKSRDALRKQDLTQIQRALEAYYNDTGSYPAHDSNYRISGVVWGEAWSNYMDTLPADPDYPDKTYVYYAPSDGQSYYLYASLDRGGKDGQACFSDGSACTSIGTNNISTTACGETCNFGVTSPNVSP